MGLMNVEKEFFFGGDFRKDPKTDHYCVVCQRDLDPNKPCEYVYMNTRKLSIVVHPDYIDEFEDVVKCAIGPECSKKVPKEFKIDE